MFSTIMCPLLSTFLKRESTLHLGPLPESQHFRENSSVRSHSPGRPSLGEARSRRGAQRHAGFFSVR